MFGILHSVVLGSVFCLSLGGAIPQTSDQMAKVLRLGQPDPEGLATHRLTADNVRRMFAVDRELSALRKTVPDLDARAGELERQIDPQRRLGMVAAGAKVHEGIPEIAQILRTHQISGREYMLTHLVAMVTAMSDDMLTAEARHEGKEVPPELMTQPLKFWRSMAPALKAEAAEWKKMQGYDKGINR